MDAANVVSALPMEEINCPTQSNANERLRKTESIEGAALPATSTPQNKHRFTLRVYQPFSITAISWMGICRTQTASVILDHFPAKKLKRHGDSRKTK